MAPAGVPRARPQNKLTAVLPKHYQSLILSVKAPWRRRPILRPRASSGTWGRGARPARLWAGKTGARVGLAPRLPLRGTTHALFLLAEILRTGRLKNPLRNRNSSTTEWLYVSTSKGRARKNCPARVSRSARGASPRVNLVCGPKCAVLKSCCGYIWRSITSKGERAG